MTCTKYLQLFFQSTPQNVLKMSNSKRNDNKTCNHGLPELFIFALITQSLVYLREIWYPKAMEGLWSVIAWRYYLHFKIGFQAICIKFFPSALSGFCDAVACGLVSWLVMQMEESRMRLDLIGFRHVYVLFCCLYFFFWINSLIKKLNIYNIFCTVPFTNLWTSNES